MTYLIPEYEEDEMDFTRDYWFTNEGPFGVSGFNSNGLEIGNFCYACNFHFDTVKQTVDHYLGKKHIAKIKGLRVRPTKLIIESSTGNEDDPENLFLEAYCKVCRADLCNGEQAESHYMSDKHQKKVRSYFLIKVGAREAPIKPREKPTIETPVGDSLKRCDLCKVNFGSSSAASDHYNGRKHAKKLKEQELDEDGVDNTVWFKCEVCDIRVNSASQLDIHTASPKHHNMAEKRRIMQPRNTHFNRNPISKSDAKDSSDRVGTDEKKAETEVDEISEEIKRRKLSNDPEP